MTPLRALAALLCSCAPLERAAPIIIDTDAGSDDIMAVALLLSHPGVQIDAITVVNGLAHVDAGARNMGRLLDLAGRKHVPVFAGRNDPLRGNAEFPAEWRKIRTIFPEFRCRLRRGRPNQTRCRLPGGTAEKRCNAGADSRAGPLTNIAEALERDRSMAAHIREIVIMGGAVRVPGNLQDGGVFHTQQQHRRMEHVYRSDGGAHRIPFGRAHPADRAGCHQQSHIDPEFLREFECRRRTRRWARVVAGVLEADRGTIDAGIFYAWDPLAAAALLRPSIVKTAAMHIEIKEDAPEEGRTAASPGKPNAKVAVDADAAAFRRCFSNPSRNRKATIP